MRRLMVMHVFTLVLVLTGGGPAAADPGNGKAQSTFQMLCDGTPVTLTVGGGTWSAAFVHETGGRFLPRATHLYVADDATGAPLFEEHDLKRPAGRGLTSICVEELRMDGMHFTFVVEGKLP